MQSFDQVYELLGVSFDHAHGELYASEDQIYLSLGEHKICREDDGALVVFHPGHKRFLTTVLFESLTVQQLCNHWLATLSIGPNEWKRIGSLCYKRSATGSFEQLF